MITDRQTLNEVDERIEGLLAERIGRAAAAGPAYERLWIRIRSAIRGGKRIRPRLLLTAHAALGGGVVEDAVTAAAAFELLHTALLIHDDMLDGDLVRRGETNLQGAFVAETLDAGASVETATAWGGAAGLLAGDLLISAVHALLGDLSAPSAKRIGALVDECLFATAAGEFADIGLALGTLDPTTDEIARMMRDKTAAYSFAAPLRAAAVLAGADSRVEADLAEIGTLIGFVYQLRDDLLGVFGSEELLGKSVDGDLREGTRTLLIAYAEGTEAWENVRHLFGRRSLDPDDAQLMRNALIASGARSRADLLLARRRDECIERVERSALPAGLRDELTRLARRCAERES
jgi:geranylgeranyl diphosphate synthase type II